MIKDLHNMDENFKSAYRQLEEEPSAEVWQKISEGLDKKDSRRRFIIWKRISFLLLLLLAGFILFDLGIIKTGGNKKSAVADASENKPGTTVKTNSNDNQTQNPGENSTFNNNATSGSTNENKEVNTESSNNNPLQQQSADLFITAGPGAVRRKSASNENKGLQEIITDNIFTDEQTNPLQKPDRIFSLHRISSFSFLPKNSNDAASHLFSSVQALNKNDNKSQPVTKNEPVADKKKTKTNFIPFWLLSGYFSYEQTGYKLDSDDPLAITTVRHREVHEPSFSGGLLLTRQIAPRWGLQTGLGYTTTQVGISPQKMYALQLPGGDIAYKFITSSGYAYIKLNGGQPPAVGDSITTSDAKHLLKHVSIPLSVRYTVGKKKFTVSPVAGVEANIITGAKVEVGIEYASNRENVIVNKLNGIKNLYWSATAGADVQYKVNKKLSVFVQPSYRQALSPITKNNVVETFPRSFGVRAGVTIKL